MELEQDSSFQPLSVPPPLGAANLLRVLTHDLLNQIGCASLHLQIMEDDGTPSGEGLSQIRESLATLQSNLETMAQCSEFLGEPKPVAQALRPLLQELLRLHISRFSLRPADVELVVSTNTQSGLLEITARSNEVGLFDPRRSSSALALFGGLASCREVATSEEDSCLKASFETASVGRDLKM